MPFYPGPRPGRALHPHRPAVPVVEAAHAEVPGAVHRARRRHQQRDARVRRRRASTDALNDAKKAVQRREDPRRRRRLQARRLRRPRVAGVRRHRTACKTRRRGLLHRSARARDRRGRAQDALRVAFASFGAYDAVVIITHHRALDWERMLERGLAHRRHPRRAPRKAHERFGQGERSSCSSAPCAVVPIPHGPRRVRSPRPLAPSGRGVRRLRPR